MSKVKLSDNCVKQAARIFENNPNAKVLHAEVNKNGEADGVNIYYPSRLEQAKANVHKTGGELCELDRDDVLEMAKKLDAETKKTSKTPAKKDS